MFLRVNSAQFASPSAAQTQAGDGYDAPGWQAVNGIFVHL